MKKTENRALKGADTTLYARIRELILSARQSVARGINLVQVYTNFEIGRHIIEHEQQGKGRAAYGQKVVGQLAKRLTEEFGGGYSRRNLELMRQFFVLYSDRQRHIAQSLTAQLSSSVKTQSMIAQSLTGGKSAKPDPFTLSWTHYVFLLGVKNPDERRFYEIEAAGQNWSLRELKRQFNTGLYERLALSRDKKGIRRLAKKGQIVETPQDMLKEPYVLEFLGLDESAKYSETELETAIINKLEHFLLELGKGFLFEARELKKAV
jgi:predicted nuclease of restriction endonuclease-like (RecB) superfamily